MTSSQPNPIPSTTWSSTGPRGRLIARNTVINVLGSTIPLVAALIAIPLLLNALGTARFGLLSLAWILIGYFGMLDLGLGRALTQRVSQKLGTGREMEVASLVRRAFLLTATLGLVCAILLAMATRPLVDIVRAVPPELREEAVLGLFALACALPAVVSTSSLAALLEAYQRFGLLNLVRAPSGAATFIGPLLAASVWPRLDAAIVALAVVRVATWVLYGLSALHLLKSRQSAVAPAGDEMRALLAMGGWLTVSSVVGPLMVYFDRFYIATAISAEAVAYYTTPFDLVNRLLTFPIAFMGVLFPAMAAAMRIDSRWLATYYARALTVLATTLFPVLAATVLFADGGIAYWLGEDFARESSYLLRWLAVGVMINIMAIVPYNLIQSAGRMDITALLHLAELPVYFLLLWWLVSQLGLLGAALAWSLRVALDAVLLFLLSARIAPSVDKLSRRALLATLAAAALLAGMGSIDHEVTKLVMFAAVMALSVGLSARQIRIWSGTPVPAVAANSGHATSDL